jgi:HAD superfamily hydrolase (TIGR01549 family)
MDRLPLVEIGGRRIPSTYGLLHAASVQWHALEFEDFAAALGAVDRNIRETWHAEHRELPTIERFRGFAERAGVNDPEMAETLTRVHMDEIGANATYLAHHAPLFERLKSRVRLAVCSNFSHGETARSVLHNAGLLVHFDPVVISDEVGIRKPGAEIFDTVRERLELAPAQVLHVGDNLSADVAGAAQAGMRTAWLTRRVADPDAALRAYTGPKPDHVIADLTELEGLLDA